MFFKITNCDLKRLGRGGQPEMDCLAMHHAGMPGSRMNGYLNWAAIEGRVIVTHDVNTMIGRPFAPADQRFTAPWDQRRIAEVVAYLIVVPSHAS